MTSEERITALEQRLAAAEARIAAFETARIAPFYPAHGPSGMPDIVTDEFGYPERCGCNPKNGGSGVCNCIVRRMVFS